MTGSSRRLIPLNRLFEPLRQITNLRCESVFRNILPECNDGIGELVEVIVSHGEVGIIRWKTQQRFGEIITLQELRGISLQFLERNALAVLIRLTLLPRALSGIHHAGRSFRQGRWGRAPRAASTSDRRVRSNGPARTHCAARDGARRCRAGPPRSGAMSSRCRARRRNIRTGSAAGGGAAF